MEELLVVIILNKKTISKQKINYPNIACEMLDNKMRGVSVWFIIDIEKHNFFSNYIKTQAGTNIFKVTWNRPLLLPFLIVSDKPHLFV